MNYAMILFILGRVLLCEGALMVLPVGVSILYGESDLFALSVTMGCCLLIGLMSLLFKPKNQRLYLRDGFIITAFSWIVISILGAMPFVLADAIPNWIDAIFETVSGFTTTGASILPEVESLPHGLLFWRSFTHWIGGMGVLVFLLAILTMTGGSHMNLMKAESPGPQVGKLTPKVQSTAKILYIIYLFMTVLEICVLLIGKMPLFDAVTTAFGTAGTGGFGIKNDSITSYSPFLQNTVTVFMIAFGVNFNFYFFLLLRKFRKAFTMSEVRAYLGIILAAIVFITWNIRSLYSLGDALRIAAFQVGSIITTTGFSTADFDLWPQASKTILVMLMFIGACAGSTGGGIKVSRCQILFQTVRKEFKQLLHPGSVVKITSDGKPIAHEVVRSVNVYLVTYVLLFAGSMLLIAFDNFSFTTNFTAVAATLNNIGPGLEMVGPTQNFALYSGVSKIVLIFDMLAGRLELFPLLLLFTRDTWRKF